MSAPYFADDLVTLWLGDCREVLPTLGVSADLVLADPPYGETPLAWDRWPDGWLAAAAGITRSLWCFGSLRLFGERWAEFTGTGWKFSHDVIWEKPKGTSFTTDRFTRVHEQPAHWYRGEWRSIYHEPPREAYHGRPLGLHARGPEQFVHGQLGRDVPWVDDGRRLMRSVLRVAGARRGPKAALHPTEKPVGILDSLITYGCPPGGLVVDPFAGSGSTLDAARCSGRRAIGIEADERHCEIAARRLSQGALMLA